MELLVVRNATLLVRLGRTRLLVDPMLGPPGALPPVAGAGARNPLTPLPMPAQALVAQADAVLLTHLHRDHLDADAVELVAAAGLPVLAAAWATPALRALGLRAVRPVERIAAVDGVLVTPTAARHARGALAEALGPVTGFLLRARGEPSLLIAGDTVFAPEFRRELRRHVPDVVVVNAGTGRLGGEGPISMDADDVLATAAAAPHARVVAVHLEALSHCPGTRAELRAAAPGVAVPEDGETLRLQRTPVALAG